MYLSESEKGKPVQIYEQEIQHCIVIKQENGTIQSFSLVAPLPLKIPHFYLPPTS